jgi:Ricin-type beta-trefoil lectin domain
VPSHSVYRLMAVGVLAIGLMITGGVPASAVGGRSIGPVQINPLGHPGLCWQASGSGEPILLERCDPTAEAQKWTLTGNGVVTNGIGYCLEAGVGEPDGTPLYIDFADQCYGQSGQVWRYVSQTGQLSSLGSCAGLSGPASTGAEIVRSACPGTASPELRWSIGYGAVTVAADGTASARAGQAFSAPVTVANAASAQTAYGVTVSFGLPPRLSVTGLVGVGAAAGFVCDVQTVSCMGTLRPGASGRIVVSGRASAGARGSQAVSARVFVARTSQLPGTVGTSASLTVRVHATPPAPTPAGGGPSGMLLYVLIAIALILLALVLVVGLTRPGWRLIGYRGHRRQPAHRAPPARSTVISRRL